MPKNKTVKRSQVSNTAMIQGGEKTISRIIMDGVVKNWVGIGWVDEGEATAEDKKKYPTLVD